MPEPFEPLRETLLRAGVAPAHVRRYVRELCDHFSDLVSEELEAGRSPDEASAVARARLGRDDALAEAMLVQPSLRSWTGRAPWATLVVGPFLLLIAAWILACFGIVFLVGWPADPNNLGPRPVWLPPEWLPRTWQAPIGTALLDLVQVGGPLLIASWVALLAAGQRSRLIWPLLGCVVVALLGATLVWDAHWPAVDPRDPLGRISFSISMGFRGVPRAFLRGAAFNLADWSQGLPLVALSLAVSAAVYWTARRASWRPPRLQAGAP
jgi:hypothetical protein